MALTRTPLQRYEPIRTCGPRYASEKAALDAAAVRTAKDGRPRRAVQCPDRLGCGGYHVRVVPAPKPAAEVKGRSAAGKGSGTGRPKPFPPGVAALLDALYPWCVKCGSPGNLHRHHRRLKGMGGDGRDHTQCACNGVRLCAECHLDWAHSGWGAAEAKAEGIIIPRSETGPWRRPLMIHAAAGSGFMAWPTCDGRLVTEMPEGALAAL